MIGRPDSDFGSESRFDNPFCPDRDRYDMCFNRSIVVSELIREGGGSGVVDDDEAAIIRIGWRGKRERPPAFPIVGIKLAVVFHEEESRREE